VAELQAYLLDVTNPEFAEQSARCQMAIRALKESSPQDVPAIEAFVLDQFSSPRIGLILSEVLPELSSVYKALSQLQTQDLAERRLAANHLRMQAELQSLSPLVVRQLRELLKEESDSLVWRMVMFAVMPDFNPETVQLVIWAANHPDGGIRFLSCEFASRHKSPEFADWLLPLLHDSETSVQLAAIQAVGECRNRIVIDGIPSKSPSQSLPGLRQLLADDDLRVSVASSIAMSRLGDPQGHDELIRLTHHPDPRIREQVILAMGQTGQSRFVNSLISLGWTAKDVRTQNAVLQSLNSLVPAANQPIQLAEAKGTEDKIRVWAGWWDQTRNVGEIR
ncbi:MAG: HEAT repeat domain-containing protein, partial [Planctomycetaceae bacterium]|nr:HEAT repeat domain-containing protein [Planctomycetaceae bacterium]